MSRLSDSASKIIRICAHGTFDFLCCESNELPTELQKFHLVIFLRFYNASSFLSSIVEITALPRSSEEEREELVECGDEGRFDGEAHEA